MDPSALSRRILKHIEAGFESGLGFDMSANKHQEASAPVRYESNEEWVVIEEDDRPPPPYAPTEEVQKQQQQPQRPSITDGLLQKALELAQKAVAEDKAQNTYAAALLYCKAANELKFVISMEEDLSKRTLYEQKYKEYVDAAEHLARLGNVELPSVPSSSPSAVGPGGTSSSAYPPAPQTASNKSGSSSPRPAGRNSLEKPKWRELELKGNAHFRAAVAHYSDRERRKSRSNFSQAASAYGQALKHAQMERQDVVGYLSQKMDKALTHAEELQDKVETLSPVTASDDELDAVLDDSTERKQQQRRARQQARKDKERAQEVRQQQRQQQLQRQQRPSIPPSWPSKQLQGGVSLARHLMMPSSAAYRDTTAKFFASMDPMKWQITNVEAIQNPAKWAAFSAKRKIMDSTLAGGAQEQQLFLGTKPVHTKTIMAQGFLREHTPMTPYGTGCYFAKKANYFLPQHVPADENGSYTLFLGSVLVGESCAGGPTKALPDVKAGGVGTLFESMVDNLTDPSVYVLGSGCDDNAYPEFVITCRRLT